MRFYWGVKKNGRGVGRDFCTYLHILLKLSTSIFRFFKNFYFRHTMGKTQVYTPENSQGRFHPKNQVTGKKSFSMILRIKMF